MPPARAAPARRGALPRHREAARTALRRRGVANPASWYAEIGGDLDAALAEIVSLAADDVLLDWLLAELATEPLAERLLIGVSVYRVPVDETGLIGSVRTPRQSPEDSDRTTRIARVRALLAEAVSHGERPEPEELGLSQADLQQFARALPGSASACSRTRSSPVGHRPRTPRAVPGAISQNFSKPFPHVDGSGPS
jgi:hypothetical protein